MRERGWEDMADLDVTDYDRCKYDVQYRDERNAKRAQSGKHLNDYVKEKIAAKKLEQSELVAEQANELLHDVEEYKGAVEQELKDKSQKVTAEIIEKRDKVVEEITLKRKQLDQEKKESEEYIQEVEKKAAEYSMTVLKRLWAVNPSYDVLDKSFEEILDDYAEIVEEQEQKRAQKDAELAEQKSELIDREASLSDREAAVNKQEKELAARDARVRSGERTLRELQYEGTYVSIVSHFLKFVKKDRRFDTEAVHELEKLIAHPKNVEMFKRSYEGYIAELKQYREDYMRSGGIEDRNESGVDHDYGR
jgi:chromosome segregation ATPase